MRRFDDRFSVDFSIDSWTVFSAEHDRNARRKQARKRLRNFVDFSSFLGSEIDDKGAIIEAILGAFSRLVVRRPPGDAPGVDFSSFLGPFRTPRGSSGRSRGASRGVRGGVGAPAGPSGEPLVDAGKLRNDFSRFPVDLLSFFDDFKAQNRFRNSKLMKSVGFDVFFDACFAIVLSIVFPTPEP